MTDAAALDLHSVVERAARAGTRAALIEAVDLVRVALRNGVERKQPVAVTKPAVRSPKGKLTALTARMSEPRAERYFLKSDRIRGLTLEIFPSGNRSFYWRGHISRGPVIAYRIGAFGMMTLAEAELVALDVMRLAKAGIDPRASRARALQRQRDIDRADLERERNRKAPGGA